MSQERPHPTLEQLTEETAEAIIFTLGATPGDPKPALIQLLLSYLRRAHEQTHLAASGEPHQEHQARAD